ncbi:MAG: hypothetical protein WKF78_01235 [Candidatus Limnocylindrales bacterium]
MQPLDTLEVWFATGSQHLYGPETLDIVAAHSARIAAALDGSGSVPVRVVLKPVLTEADGIRRLCQEANAADACIGLITWMHTFSPAKMWIAGLDGPAEAVPASPYPVQPRDPVGDDRHGLHEPQPGRPRRPRVRVHGRSTAPGAQRSSSVTGVTPRSRNGSAPGRRAACARRDWETGQIARFGENMRNVAVTEGDKVEARSGGSVSGSTATAWAIWWSSSMRPRT